MYINSYEKFFPKTQPMNMALTFQILFSFLFGMALILEKSYSYIATSIFGLALIMFYKRTLKCLIMSGNIL